VAAILITGFEPFSGFERNSSGEAALALDGRTLGGSALRGIRLPVEYGLGFEKARLEIESLAPRAVVLTGLAPGKGFRLEQFAVNAASALEPDNAGNTLLDTPIDPKGPPAVVSTLPLEEMKAALEAAGFEAAVSYSAGTYVCNDAFYRFGVYAALRGGPPGGFVHVPPLPLDGREGMELDCIVEALEVMLEPVSRICS
jgi:pyroglutamyl-peptidase